jgi:hypothetical protein
LRLRQIGNVDEALSAQLPLMKLMRGNERSAEYRRKGLWDPAHCNCTEIFAIRNCQGPMIGTAEGVRLFQYRVEHWGEVARRC